MKLKVGTKLGLGFGIVIFILVIGAGIGIIQLNKTTTILKDVSSKYVLMSIDSGDIRSYFDEIAWATKNILLRGQDKGVFIAEQAIMDDRRRILDEKSNLLKNAFDTIDPEFRVKISKLYNNYTNELAYFDKGWKEAIPVFKTKGMLPADEIMKGRGRRVVQSLKTLNYEITSKSISELEKAAALSTTAITVTVITLFVSVLVSLIISMSLSNKIRKTVTYLANSAEKISLGELDQPIEVASKDEFADLATAFDRMRISFKKSMERLKGKNV